MSEWTDFMKGKMGKYMKKYGSHGKAIQALSREYKSGKSSSTKTKLNSAQLKRKAYMLRKSHRR